MMQCDNATMMQCDNKGKHYRIIALHHCRIKNIHSFKIQNSLIDKKKRVRPKSNKHVPKTIMKRINEL